MENDSQTNSTRTCRKCHRVLPLTEFQTVNAQRGWSRHECKDCTRTRIKTWWNSDPNQSKSYTERWQRNYAKRKEYLASPEARKQINENVRQRVKYLQTLVYEGYGGKCKCCGEANWGFLSIDHVNNDGNVGRKYIKDRQKRARGASGADMYRYILKNDFPPTLQLLCYNCNIGRHRNGGTCPHISSQERSTAIP